MISFPMRAAFRHLISSLNRLYRYAILFRDAIYVGTIFEDSLEMQSEFSEKKKEISGYDIVKSDATVSATTSLKVYDVILAGVCV